MPSYETNQIIAGFIRKVKASFDGFNSQSISILGKPVPMLHAKLGYRGSAVHLALLAQPGESHDTLIFSLPLFRVPSNKAQELFEQLLSWNNGATGSVHFALDELMNTANIVCVRPVEGLVFQEFQSCLDQMLNVRLNAMNKLRKDYETLAM